MKKIFILGVIFLLFIFLSKVNAEDSCNIVTGVGWIVVPTNETSRTQQATLEAINAIDPNTETPGWNGSCYVGDMMLFQWTVCQDGSAQLTGLAFGNYVWDVVCGSDNDNDGMINMYDNCPDTPNPNQEDADNDRIGDACDSCPNDGLNDADGDAVCGDVDNCPDVSNSNQEDADNDGIGDVCDPDTIYGTISGVVQGGISIDIYVYSCGTATTVATIATNAEGYYAAGGLGTDSYGIIPYYPDYVFSPKTRILQIPQTDIRSYDFTATSAP